MSMAFANGGGGFASAMLTDTIQTVTADVGPDLPREGRQNEEIGRDKSDDADEEEGPLEVFLMAAGKALGEKLQER